MSVTLGQLRFALLTAVFAVVAVGVFWPALPGPFVSDDLGYVVTNAYIHELSAGNLAAILDPGGPAAMYTANYAPVHLLAHALEWQLFEAWAPGYRVVNVLLHGLTSALLVVLFARLGIPRLAALLLGAVFLVHPANVEAVAWVFQLKTVLALLLSVLALLLLRAYPLAATLLFALALLTKISAAYALPVAAVALHCRPASAQRREWAWLLVWGGVLLLAALPEFTHFSRFTVADAYPDGATQLRSIVALAGRYLVMASTSFGVSAFHEPAPTASLADPWFLLGLALLVLLAGRLLHTLRRRSPEAVFWVWALSGWAPISQLFPFPIPLADRYLYFVLPGLLGGGWLLGRALLAGVLPRMATLSWAPRARVGALLAAALLLALAAHAHARAVIWSAPDRLLKDTARHYPEGRSAGFLHARKAIVYGDLDAANAQLLRIAQGGYDGFLALQQEPTFAPLHGTPGFQEALSQCAANWIRHVEGRDEPSQEELYKWALALQTQGRIDAARAKLAQALEHAGPLEPTIRAQLDALAPR